MMSFRFSPLAAGLGAILAAAIVLPAVAAVPTIDTTAQNAIVIDYETGAVMFDKGADERIPPASMSKMMTAYVVYTYLKSGQAKMTDELPVSEAAWRTGGSKMFVPLGGRVSISDLLQGMIIQSGNDACVVLAEGLAGSQQAFVDEMNQMAKKLGLTGTHYADVNGLPAPGEYTTVRDLATLARHLIADFPQYYHYEAVKEFTYNGIKQGNRNPLLYKDLGVDGVKTGHTDEAGYGITISAVRNGRRIIFVLSGMSSMQARATESEKVLEWAYRTFDDYHLVKAGEPIDEAPVWMGAATKVPATTAQDVVVTLPRLSRPNLKVMAEYDGPVTAPVRKGERVGTLVVSAPDFTTESFPLIAAQPVARLDPMGRVAAAAGYLLWGRHN